MVTRLESLAGQGEAARRLEAALAQGRLHHALLFSGPDGVGKFACAKLLAQIVQCSGGDSTSACGRCPGCTKITTAGHADVLILEPDDKDSIKVDAIREATQALYLKPIEGRFRLLLIRDADRMNPQAQNALLKTLEEPPGEAHLILTTSRPDAVLPTVRSRCSKVPFHPVPTAAISALLVEHKGIDRARADLVAALAQGAPGVAFQADPDHLIAARDRIADLDRRLSTGDVRRSQEAIAVAESLAKELEWEDLREQLDLFAVWLRDQALLAAQVEQPEIANADRLEDLRELAAARGSYEVLRRARTLERCRRDLDSPYNLNTQLVVEQLCLGLIGWGRRTDERS
ncbi:MAG: DNA polymerase III subunit delta' [Deltaproteobacteria bacterium]|nr:DNA polymerase III subunit delta' [Deltaproteobacteria bacterium]